LFKGIVDVGNRGHQLLTVQGLSVHLYQIASSLQQHHCILAFVRLYNKKTDKEIIFVAEQDSSKAYKFDMDVGNNGKNFNYQSGTYSIYLTVGDASLSNSFEWLVAEVQLKFSEDKGNISR